MLSFSCGGYFVGPEEPSVKGEGGLNSHNMYFTDSSILLSKFLKIVNLIVFGP